MTNIIFQEIDALHSEWCQVELASKIGYLMVRQKRLLALANEMARGERCEGTTQKKKWFMFAILKIC